MTAAPGWDGPDAEPWRSGRWSLALAGDELADVAFDGRSVLRSIRAVVRDRDWATVQPEVVAVERTGAGLRVALRFAGLGADLRGDLVVSAEDDRLRVALRLRSGTTFLRNRVGLVALHASDVAGLPLAALHPDGTRTDTAFPDRIAPHQPATDVRALVWEHAGVRTRLAFEGDVFEMEDQRNWTDASFKTYSTPLGEPFPVLLAEGDVVRQSLVLACEVTGAAPPADRIAPIILTRTDDRLPAFSLGATTEPGPVPVADAGPLLVELLADHPGWRDALARAAQEAGDGGLDVRVVTDTPEVVPAVVDALAEVRVIRLGVYGTTTHRTEAAIWLALRDAAAGRPVALVGGTRAHFTELNREHGDLPADLPALTFSSTPQMHAVEARQLMESVAMQRLTAEDAVRIAAGRPVHVGPVTLRPRFNAVATTPQHGPPADATDPRQKGEPLAAWVVASAAAFAVPGVASVSWFEASGPRGIRTAEGEDLPVRLAVLDVLELAGAVAVAASPTPSLVHVLAGTVGVHLVALVANLRSAPIALEVGPAGALVALSVPAMAYRRVTWPA